MRRLSFPFWLAGARLRRRGGSLVLVVLGLAAATAMLAAVLAGTVAAQDREVGRQVEQLPAKVRSVRVNWFSVGGQVAPYATLDGSVRRQLGRVLPERATGTSLYREHQFGGALLSLGAVDDLGRWVRLRSGRLPRVCRPQHCEVLVVRRGGPITNVPGLRLVPVGEGDLRTATLFGDAIPAQDLGESAFVEKIRRYHRPAPPPLVLANGVAALDRSPVLHDAYRSYGWVVPLRRGTVRSWSADALATRIEQARTAFQGSSFGFELTAPTDELLAAADSARVAGRRLLLLGGEAVALLLAFAVLVAARQRPDAEALLARLSAAGVARWQSGLVVFVESLLAAVAGTVLGWLAGSAAAAAIAGRSGEPAGALLAHSVLSGRGLAIAAAVAAVAALVVTLALVIEPLRLGGLALSPLDVAAIGAALAVVIALARGSANASELLAANGTGLVLLLLPALVGFAAAVAVARLLPLALRGLERVVPENALALRLAALGLARRPGYAAVAVAFVVVSVGFALFASSYRSTLVVAQRQEAAFAVPADEVVSEDLAQLIPVRSVVTPTVERSLGARVSRVTRVAGNITGADVTGITVLGLPRSTLAGIGGWRSDFASAAPSELARDVDPQPAGRAARPADPGRRAEALAADGRAADAARARRLRGGAGRLVRPDSPGPQRGAAPAGARRAGAGARRAAAGSSRSGSSRRRSSRSAAPTRALRRSAASTLGPPRVDGRPLTDYGDWLGTVGVDHLTRARRAALPRHAHERGRHLSAPAPADGRPADPGGRLAVPGHARRSRPRPRRDRQRRPAPVPGRGRRAALPGHLAERDLRLPGRRPARARQRAQHRRARHRLRDRALAGQPTRRGARRSRRACASRRSRRSRSPRAHSSSTRCAPSRSPAPRWRCWRPRR